MSTKVEKLEHNLAKLTVEVPAEEFERAMEQSYQRMKGRLQVPGFRKGKAPRKIIEKMYGAGVFFEEAANLAIQNTYEDAVKESELTVMSRPQIDIETIEEGSPFVYTAEVAVRPEVTLKKYKGLNVPKMELEVTDEEVDRALDAEREKNARIVPVEGRAVQEGDIITLDYEGSVDGVPFDGGKAENYELTIGSHTFIPGFEEQLVGKNVGEPCNVEVRFPDEYHAEDLKGKEAVFACLIHKIAEKQMPEADDDFAMDVSEFDTIAEYREDLKKNLTEEKEKRNRTAKENAAVAALIEEMEADIPDLMIDSEAENIERDYEMRLRQQGMPLETYLSYMGMDPATFREQLKPQAENQIRTRLALEAVVDAENLSISDERYEEELKKMAESYDLDVEKIREMMDGEAGEQMKLDLAVQDAVTLITDAAVEVDMPEEKEAEEE